MPIKRKFDKVRFKRNIEAMIKKEADKIMQQSYTTEMNGLTRNEILTLKHLSDEKQHNDAPQGLTDAQFYAAAKSLNARDMVYALFLEGGRVGCTQIKTSGKAVLDDMRVEEKRIIRRIVRTFDLTLDQFELLQHARKTGKCENIFNIDDHEYKEQIFKPLYKKNIIKSDYDEHQNHILVLTRSGEQIFDEIETELNHSLSDESIEEDIHKAENNKAENRKVCPVKDSGFRINDSRITDFIKIVWSMHDIGMFVDKNGDKPSAKSVMDAFAKFLKANQFEQYSSYMNRGLSATKNTYLDIFSELEESAEKHYNSKAERKLDR